MKAGQKPIKKVLENIRKVVKAAKEVGKKVKDQKGV